METIEPPDEAIKSTDEPETTEEEQVRSAM
jgi:hypothetical protein